jgi:hypothetical protein
MWYRAADLPSARSRALLLLVSVLACGVAAGAWGQSTEPAEPAAPGRAVVQPTHTLGDQVLQISAGLFVPLFFQAVSPPDVAVTGLTLGGAGSLQWNAYVSKDIRIGIEVGGMFAFSKRRNTLLMVPIDVKASYVFAAYPFEFPVSLGVGVNVVKYVDDVYVDPILKPGFGVFWQFDVTWSFGLNVVYWWVPHISTAADTRFGNFLEITLSALYNF